MLNDLVVADILANGTPNLYFDARVSTADQIVQYLRGLVDQLYMLYYDGYISHYFWEGCHERSLYCRVPFLLPCPPEAFVEYCKLVDAFLKYLNDNLAMAIRCEVALGVLYRNSVSIRDCMLTVLWTDTSIARSRNRTAMVTVPSSRDPPGNLMERSFSLGASWTLTVSAHPASRA